MPMSFYELFNFFIIDFMADCKIKHEIGCHRIAFIVDAYNILDYCLDVDWDEVGCEMFFIVLEDKYILLNASALLHCFLTNIFYG